MSERKFRFTKKRLEVISKPEKRIRYYDKAVEGLILDVTPNLVLSFRVYKWLASENKPINVTLGKFPSMTIEQARTQAKKKLIEISDGKNPIKEKKAKKQEGYTLDYVFNDYLDKKALRSSTIRGYQQVIDCYFKCYKDKPFKVINEAVIKKVHAEVSLKSNAQADLAMRVVRALFNFAKYEYRGSNNEFIFGENPVKILSHLRNWNHVPRKHSRLSKSQIPTLLTTLDKIRNEADLTADLFVSSVCDFVEVALLTGLRKSELLNLTWDAINLKERTYCISKTKNGEPLQLPISNRLFEVFKHRLEQKTQSNYVFNSNGKYGRVVEPKKVIAKIIDKSGVDFTLHDLRRTFTSIAEALNVGTYSIKRLLNHKSRRDDVTAGYTILTADELAIPAELISKEIVNLINVPNKESETYKDISDMFVSLPENEKQKLLIDLASLQHTYN